MDRHDYDALRIENQLCFPLYASSREVIRQYKPHLDGIGLTYTQYIAMMVLWQDGSVTAKELGRRLRLDSGTLTPLLKKLEAKGLIRRQRLEEDERSLLLTITEEGAALKERAAEIPARMVSCTGLDASETMELYRLLYKLLGQRGG